MSDTHEVGGSTPLGSTNLTETVMNPYVQKNDTKQWQQYVVAANNDT